MTVEFPDLSGAEKLSIDLETCDPAIAEGLGSGALRGGFIAGVGIGTNDGFREYYPIAHECGDNLDRDKVLAYCRDQFSKSTQPKVGANLLYDLEYLAVAGVSVSGWIQDVLIAEPLLDEKSFSYSLEGVSQKYLGEGKPQEYLYQHLAQRFGGKPERKKQAGNIWRADPKIVREYVLGDIDLPLRVIEKQLIALAEQDLTELFILESKLIPMLLAMKLRGVKVDVSRAEHVYDDLTSKIQIAQAELGPYNVNASASLAGLWDKLGLTYPRTAKTKAPSFTKEVLAACSHPIARTVETIKTSTKLRDTFIKNVVMESNIHGRIHCQFNQLRSDEYGTVSGRFSSSNPNLQQIPAKGEGTNLVRTLFLPDSEDEEWTSIDYSQIEYRCFAHYADDEYLLEAYKDPKVDFHAVVGDMLGGALDRKIVKTFNFASLYGAGFRKIATMLRSYMSQMEISTLYENLGELRNASKFSSSCMYIQRKEPFTPDIYDVTAFRVLEVYDEKFPAAKKIMDRVGAVAKNRGYIKTILNRRRRFAGESTHKALNALLQGTAADIMKKGMVDIWESGVIDVVGVPTLTVHDELCWSVPKTAQGREAIDEAYILMRDAIKLAVPIHLDIERGPNWGDAK
jgi:DNA polymerase I-like protein with 3'-5' exonuclease and polymerase domains